MDKERDCVERLIEPQVVNKDLAEQLSKLGIHYHCLYIWYLDHRDEKWKLTEGPMIPITRPLWDKDVEKVEWFHAYTVAELGQIINKHLYNEFSSRHVTIPIPAGKEWLWYQEGKLLLRADTEANARAKYLIYHIENSIMKL